MMVLQVPVDFIILLLAAASAYYLRFSQWVKSLKPVLFDLTFSGFLIKAVFVALAWLVVFALLKLYSPDPNKKFADEIIRIFFGCSIGLALVALYIVFTQDLFASRFLIAVGWGLAIVYVVLGRLIIRGVKGLLHRLGYGLKQVVIVGSGEIADNITETLQVRDDLEFEVLGQFDHFEDFVDSDQSKQDLDELIFTNPKGYDEQESIEAIEWCNENHVVFKYSADMFSAFSSKVDVNPLAGVPIVEIKRTKLEGWGRVIKRVVDVLGAACLIIISSPLMVLAALALYLESGRPMIYKNKRVGENGTEFLTLKFRSYYPKYCIGPQFSSNHNKQAQQKEQELIEDRNSRDGPIYKVKDDPRVTPVGEFLRKWSLDELPQFFNVLAGEMSLVGPRPHQPEEVDQYDPKFRQVLSVKPGITGLAQISGRSDLSFEEEMRLDIFYIRNWNLFLDLIILVKTPFVVLFKSREAV